MILLKRHDLVWLKKSAWQNLIKAQPFETQEILSQWPQENWPAVVCRNESTRPEIAIGISLLDSQNKKIRVAGFVESNDILNHQNALALKDVLFAAPMRWQAQLVEFLTSPYQFSVFGSLSWQAITKKNYVSPSSDIDLLYRPRAQSDLDGALKVWQEFAKRLPLDGEIEFQSGEAVSFREWQRSERLLCKSLTEVRLRMKQDLTASLGKFL
jgi:phosphoribosyl-dephospho-CoA transferase